MRSLTIAKLKQHDPEFKKNPSIANFIGEILKHQEDLFSYKSYKEQQQKDFNDKIRVFEHFTKSVVHETEIRQQELKEQRRLQR